VNLLQIIVGGIIAMVAIALPFFAMNIQWILDKGWVDDAFAAGNMKAEVSWTGFEALAGLILAIGLIFYGLNATKKIALANRILLFSSLICVMLLTLLVTPRIEGYSQRAAIEFCEGTVEKKAYVHALGYQSYAPLFYAKKQPDENPNARDIKWLLSGETDKDVYFLVKVDALEEIQKEYPSFQLLYEKNGFAFLKRNAFINDKK
jgi:hypothetical protein